MDFSLQSQSSFNQSSSFFKPSVAKKFDLRVVEKLISYVEATLDAKLEKIGSLIDKNCKNMAFVRRQVTSAELDLIKIKREKESENGSLLSEDIKFFFNMVKANPNLRKEDLESSQAQQPEPKYGKQAAQSKTLKRADDKEN